MVKIYYANNLNQNIIDYTFNELFRYIDIDFIFSKECKKADIVYNDINCKSNNKIQIMPSKIFWENYKKVESLPTSPLLKEDDTTYIYENDIVSSTFFMLSGYEEYLNPQRDRFNRFLYQYSYYKEDAIYTKPIVEQYRDILIEQLNSIGIECKRKNIWKDKEFGLFLTHDVDGVYKYRSTLKSIIKIFLKPSKFTFKELFESKKNIKKDPYFKGFEYLINQSNKYNFKSTFFFISKVREKLDSFYNINDNAIKKVIQEIKDNDFEIGLHGSLKSSINKKYIIDEKNNLKSDAMGIRQHYLMYDITQTSDKQKDNFIYDSSLGFADMIGFRRGSCLPFKLYNIEKDCKLELFEIPLNVMEMTLKEYMKLPMDKLYIILSSMIDEIKKYNGVFTLLWHPGNCSDEWNIWLENIYEPILKELNEKSILSLTGNDIIRLVNKNEI